MRYCNLFISISLIYVTATTVKGLKQEDMAVNVSDGTSGSSSGGGSTADKQLPTREVVLSAKICRSILAVAQRNLNFGKAS